MSVFEQRFSRPNNIVVVINQKYFFQIVWGKGQNVYQFAQNVYQFAQNVCQKNMQIVSKTYHTPEWDVKKISLSGGSEVYTEEEFEEQE